MTIQGGDVDSKMKRIRLRNMPKELRYSIYSFTTVMTLGIGYIAYLSGNIKVDFSLNDKLLREISDLRDEKSVLISKINEYHRNIPLMREEFVQQYQDSLTKTVQDTSAINTKVSNLESEIAKNKDKTVSSWLYYFF